MRRAPTAGTAAADADPAAPQFAPVARRRRGRPWLAIGLAAYLVTLIATFPARFVVAPGPRWAISGTVWTGEAVIDGAYRLEWRWAPWRSLGRLAFAADVRVTGSGTDLAGSASVSPGRVVLDGLAGTGDGGLLAAFGPPLPFACDMRLQIDLPQLVVAGTSSSARGEIRGDPGACAAPGGGATSPVPAMLARIEPRTDGVTAIDVTAIGRGRTSLFRGGIAGGRLRLAPTAAGIAALPFTRGLTIDEAM